MAEKAIIDEKVRRAEEEFARLAELKVLNDKRKQAE